ncbi:MAG: NAD(P)/FAD-dependent oxidoreductase, partial [Candidatus Aenigmarchaeota archaeon]|nr:NAD(P)/FAD-dependent oxidoreductase [Candidatus Aenigmarchaeota archaeon]
IVGAGPAGSTMAGKLLILNKKHKVCIVEEHKKAGTPQQCSGLFSKNILDLTKLKKNEIIQEIKGANFYSPSGSCISIETKQTQAYVVDRTIFDARLCDEVKKAGAKLMYNTRFISAKKIDNYYRITVFDKNINKTKTIISKYIVGCDGAYSTVANTFSFPKVQSLYGYCIFAKAKTKKDIDFIANNKVELYFGKKTAPDFFLWKIPRETENTIEIGVASSGNPFVLIEKFMAKEKINKKDIVEKMGGLIPFEIRKQIIKDGVVLVGDAAGQVKATTGGGVVWGMKCAKIAAEALNKAIDQNSEKCLQYYALEFNKNAKPELRRLKLLRSFLNSRSDGQLNNVFETINNNPEMIEFTKNSGDMDSISPAFFSLLKKPKLWFVFAKAGLRSLV